MLRAIGMIAAVLVQPPDPSGPAGAGPDQIPTGRVCHVRVTGDLETRKLATDVTAELSRANQDKAGLIVLELESERAREDLVWEVGRAVHESPVPVAVFLHNGPGGRVGPGALEIGIMANSCFVGPRTVVRMSAADDVKWTAPADVNWERTVRELSGAVWAGLSQRGADPSLAEVLVSPEKSRWCGAGESGKPWMLSASQPIGPGARSRQIVFAGGAGYERLEIDAGTLGELGAARTGASNLGQVMSAMGRGAASRSTRTITGGLGEARAKVNGAFDDAKVSAQRVTELLDVKRRIKGRTITPSDYREAGQQALAELDRAGAGLASAEALMATYPELLREPPSPVAPAKKTKAADPVVVKLTESRKELDKLRSRAREYQSR